MDTKKNLFNAQKKRLENLEQDLEKLKKFESITFLPVLHYQMEYAQLARMAIKKLQPDAIALELPFNIKENFIKGVKRLPFLSIILMADTDSKENPEKTTGHQAGMDSAESNDAWQLLTIEPTDPMVEAARHAIEQKLPVHLVDTPGEVGSPQSDPFIDPYTGYLFNQTFVNSLVADNSAFNPSHAFREDFMASRLIKLSRENKKILFLCGCRHTDGIIKLLKRKKESNSIITPFPDKMPGESFLFNPSPDMIRSWFNEMPLLMASWESARTKGFTNNIKESDNKKESDLNNEDLNNEADNSVNDFEFFLEKIQTLAYEGAASGYTRTFGLPDLTQTKDPVHSITNEINFTKDNIKPTQDDIQSTKDNIKPTQDDRILIKKDSIDSDNSTALSELFSKVMSLFLPNESGHSIKNQNSDKPPKEFPKKGLSQELSDNLSKNRSDNPSNILSDNLSEILSDDQSQKLSKLPSQKKLDPPENILYFKPKEENPEELIVDFMELFSEFDDFSQLNIPFLDADTFENIQKKSINYSKLAFKGALHSMARDICDLDRLKLIIFLVNEAEKIYTSEFDDTIGLQGKKNLFHFARNYSLLEKQILPDLWRLITAARGVGGDSFAIEVHDLASTWPWQDCSDEYETFDPELAMNEVQSRRIKLQRKYNSRISRQKPAPLRLIKKHFLDEGEHDALNLCSYPPEDIIIENWADHLVKKGDSFISAENEKIVEFTTSMLDGISIRDTMKHWPDKKIFVREKRTLKSSIGAVVVIFSEDKENNYDWKMTWQGEHDQESDMALYSTKPEDDMAGPGIFRCRYGGFVMTYPPGRMYSVWEDPAYALARDKPEHLLMAAVEYSLEKNIVYVAASPPSSRIVKAAKRLDRRIIYFPLGTFSQSNLKKIRVFHVLSGNEKRATAKDYISR